jgi:small subunit ribosomal protein S8
MTFVTDPIGDLLTRMRNAQAARRTSCRAPHSLLKQELCELLKREGWIADVQVTGEAPKLNLVVTFLSGKRRLTLERISKPGRRVTTPYADLKPVLRGYGQAILTTSQGLLTDAQARERKLGGEVLCTVS